MNKKGILYRIYDLYADGFRSMKLGRTLWAIILIKLFVLSCFSFQTSLRNTQSKDKNPNSWRLRFLTWNVEH